MLEIEINLLTNNSVIPFQGTYGLPFIEFNKLFATKSLAEHGLGFLINIHEKEHPQEEYKRTLIKKIIFDAGGSNLTFLHNINVRGYPLYDVDAIALSHWHYDHTGAFYDILCEVEREIPVYCHDHALFERFFRRSEDLTKSDLEGKTRQEILPYLLNSKLVNQEPIDPKKVERLKGKLIFTREPQVIHETSGFKMIVLGEIERTFKIEDFHGFYFLQEGIIKEDKILDDRCLILELEDQCILLIGCCHSGIMNTINQVRKITNKPITHVIGGFHMASASHERMESTIQYLQSICNDCNDDNPLYLFPIHCSGSNFLNMINSRGFLNLKAFDLSVGTKFLFSTS